MAVGYWVMANGVGWGGLVVCGATKRSKGMGAECGFQTEVSFWLPVTSCRLPVRCLADLEAARQTQVIKIRAIKHYTLSLATSSIEIRDNRSEIISPSLSCLISNLLSLFCHVLHDAQPDTGNRPRKHEPQTENHTSA